MVDRPLIEFVAPESIEWETLSMPFAAAPVRARRLVGAVEAGDGAALIELPDGWRSDVRTTAPFELIVLEGELEASGTALGRYGYVSSVAGADAQLRASSGPVLAFVDAIADVTEQAVVPHSEEDWTAGGLGQMPGLTRRIVRGAVDTSRGFFLRVPAGWSEHRTEWHDCAEAALLLDGSLWHDRANGGAGGTMRRHCYFWRPRHVLHSPMGSEDGATIWVYVDGFLKNHFVEEEGGPPA
jgi:hypothetical protein